MRSRCYYLNISASSYLEKYVAHKETNKKKICLCISRKLVQQTVFRSNLNLKCSHPPTKAASTTTEVAKFQHLLSVTQASHECCLIQTCESFTAQRPSPVILSRHRSEHVDRISAQGVKLNTWILKVQSVQHPVRENCLIMIFTHGLRK